jgi:hypothetical protein
MNVAHTEENERNETKASSRKRLLTEQDFEAQYGIPRRTIQKMRFFGGGPRYRKVGSSVYYALDDIELWLESLPSGGGKDGLK